MLPRDKYTIFARYEKRYRKSIHSMPIVYREEPRKFRC
jgi:hypothetical protein